MVEYISKSEKKRIYRQVDDLAVEVANLSDKELRAFPGGPVIHEEIVATRGLKGGSRKRQIKYLAKVLRQGPLEEIYLFVTNRKGSQLHAQKQFHTAERMRDTLINEAIDSADVKRDRIDYVVLSGNTTMLHLLLQIEPRKIRREPYIPAVSAFPVLKAGNIGLKVNPVAAVFVMPGPASYVGGDIVSGLIYTGFHREEPMTLFIDVGTNGEIVLGNKDWLMTASCSAGPAFEGGGVRWGMRAEDGAIEKIVIDPDTNLPCLSVVGDSLPRGICGSGMIDLISEMMRTGIIQQNGKFKVDSGHPRMTQDGDEKAYIVVLAEETSVDKDILFMESDIDNIIRSKGAV